MKRRKVVFAATLFFVQAQLCSAVDIDQKTQIILSEGVGLGVGGGIQDGFSLVNVCDAKKVVPQVLPIIVRLAMHRIDSTIDSTFGIRIAPDGSARWKTAPTFFGPEDVEAYNKLANKSEQLYRYYKYYYKIDATLSKMDDIVYLETKTALYIGTKPEELESYSGLYSPKGIHEKLATAIAESTTQFSCNQRGAK